MEERACSSVNEEDREQSRRAAQRQGSHISTVRSGCITLSDQLGPNPQPRLSRGAHLPGQLSWETLLAQGEPAGHSPPLWAPLLPAAQPAAGAAAPELTLQVLTAAATAGQPRAHPSLGILALQ